MLILTRRPGEIIRIGGDTKITVMGIKGNQIRVGIEAPHNVVVDREEIFQRKQAQAGQSRPAEAYENGLVNGE